MPEGPIRDRVLPRPVLSYIITVENEGELSEIEVMDVAASAVDGEILPEIATGDVDVGRVQEEGVPRNEQDISAIIETEDMTVSNVTLNRIEERVDKRLSSGNIAMVSVQARANRPLRRILERVRE